MGGGEVSAQPPLELFSDRVIRRGWAIAFVNDLVLNTPVVVPVQAVTDNKATTIRKAAARLNKRVTFRTYEGQVWCCFIGDAS